MFVPTDCLDGLYSQIYMQRLCRRERLCARLHEVICIAEVLLTDGPKIDWTAQVRHCIVKV